MTEPTFMTDEGFATIKAMYRLRKVLQREGRVYLTELHKRCAVGLSTAQFEAIVQKLEASQWCTTRKGALGATLVIFNDYFKSINVPDVPDSQPA